MATVRLRSGKHPPTGMKASPLKGRITPEPVTAPTPQKRPKGKGGMKLPTVPTPGRKLIKQSGGTKADVKTWRKLPMGQRQRIKGRVAQRGGSLTAAVRKIGTLKGR